MADLNQGSGSDYDPHIERLKKTFDEINANLDKVVNEARWIRRACYVVAALNLTVVPLAIFLLRTAK